MPIYAGQGSGGLAEIGGLYVGTAAGGFTEIASAWEWNAGQWVELWKPATAIPAEQQTFTYTSATQIYQPPVGATRIVFIALGGGGNGDDGDPDGRGEGGDGGGWGGTTLYPPFAANYYVTVGNRSAASYVRNTIGGDAVNLVTGAAGRNGTNGSTTISRQAGKSPGTYNYGGVSRSGGGQVSGNGTAGIEPGGGGSGDRNDGSGGPGAPGRVWAIAYFD